MRTIAAIPFLVVLAVLGTGCDVFDPDWERAEQAQVIIDGTTSVPLTLVTSGQFLVVPDPETGALVTELVLSDTVEIELPYQDDFSMGEFERFLVRLINPDTAAANVRMQVYVDGRLEYDRSATMSEASLEFIFRVARGR
jgi:hypothetical protein